MEQLIDFHAPEIQAVLPLLLQDKSTGHNIIWATDPPEELRDSGVTDKSEITIPQLQQIGYDALLPRQLKQDDDQRRRTRKKGEVFTPAWVCNKMNNLLDADWFGRDSRFNMETEQSWQAVFEPVSFPEGKKTPAWQKYVDSRRLEITCGEAPFLVSRYDAATGVMIPVAERIGILDRKLRVVAENTCTETDRLKWTYRAVQATYGYEYQGDSLLLARTNLLLTAAEYLQAHWQHRPTTKELKKLANIIAWNVWQMDGLKQCVPGGKHHQQHQQLDFFSLLAEETQPVAETSCRVRNWRSNATVFFGNIQEGSTRMKFDYVIGNPPYQDETLGDNKGFAPPVYNKFLDASYEIANKVEMIHPARFLFNAGGTPKVWNQKMLENKHFKILYYEADSEKVFHGTDIKGGISISYFSKNDNYGAVGTFTPYNELNTILAKVRPQIDESLSKTVSGRGLYRLSEKALQDYPEIEILQSKGHKYDVGSGAFKILDGIIFHSEKPNDSYEYGSFLGLLKGERVYRWLRKDYFDMVDSFNHYKVFVPKANGSGALGEVLSTPVIGLPVIGHTETFLSIGNFETLFEAQACMAYIKTKFARVMLGVLKITQDNPSQKWKYVPLQNFTPNSDIDWSVPIPQIDQQLYRKYGLNEQEIEFIETHVKEMT